MTAINPNVNSIQKPTQVNAPTMVQELDLLRDNVKPLKGILASPSLVISSDNQPPSTTDFEALIALAYIEQQDRLMSLAHTILRHAQAVISSSETANAKMLEELEKLSQESAQLTEQVQTTEAKIATLDNEIAKINGNISTVQDTITSLKAKGDSLTEAEAALLSSSIQELSTLKALGQTKTMSSAKLKQELADLKGEISINGDSMKKVIASLGIDNIREAIGSEILVPVHNRKIQKKEKEEEVLTVSQLFTEAVSKSIDEYHDQIVADQIATDRVQTV